MTSAPPVEILLATYQGERFLEAQLDSLLAQTFDDWSLIARDDGSTDGTVAILERYARLHPGRIRLLPSGGRRLGAAGNFAELLAASGAPYVMLCDQDDVWLPEKIEVTLAAMKELEARHGAGVLALVHTDQKIVDEDLRPLAASGWRYAARVPGRLSTLSRVLLQNFATGCTVMANRSLVALASPIPPGARMHDSWLALVAVAFGAVRAVPQATILYRQHGGNECGAGRFQPLREALGVLGLIVLDRRRFREASDRRWTEIAKLEKQATAFLDRFGERLSERDREAVAAFATLSRQGFFTRRARILRHRFFYSSPMTTAGMLLLR